MKLTTTARTHIGRRANNEDSLICEPSLGLFAVCDGMGGYEGGEIASQLAVETVTRFIARNLRDADVTWPYKLDRHLSLDENLVLTAARLAHEQIAGRRHGVLEQMGSTLAMMLTRGPSRAIIAHVGDSRVYRLRDVQLEQLTVDHSMYEELVRTGNDNMPSRKNFPYSNVITRALGINGPTELTPVDLATGDIYLLCTDGLSEVLEPEEMAEILRVKPLDEACNELVESAYYAGGRDNITAVLVKCDPCDRCHR